METNFNFNSAICTSREQSEKLLSLGLKKETADMCLEYSAGHYCPSRYRHYNGLNIPAWSLHRLIEMLPRVIDCDVENGLSIDLFNANYDGVTYYEVLGYYTDKNLYNSIIYCIEDLIKEGYFNKEYLEEE